MRRLRFLHSLAVFIALTAVEVGSAIARPACDPRKGDTAVKKVQDLNVLKTRTEMPTNQDFNSDITLSAITAPGDDRDRWQPSMAAAIVGYVAKVGVGGIESVNCHAMDAAHRDTHIDLVVSANDANDETKHVIVEVTPQFRALHPDWSTANLRSTLLGRCAKFTGWMMFDEEHVPQSLNTAPSNSKDWRVTAWEIHPITAIERLPACPR